MEIYRTKVQKEKVNILCYVRSSSLRVIMMVSSILFVLTLRGSPSTAVSW